jgi:hypothetical protein
MMAKDLATAASLASSIGMPMRLGQGADHTEMYRWLAPSIA